MTTTRETLLASAPPTVQAIDCPELGASVHLRVMSGADREQLENELTRRRERKQDLVGIKFALLRRVICEPDGTLTFGPDDEAAFMSIDCRVVERLFSVAQTMNLLDDRSVEDHLGNSPAPGDAG